MGAIEILTSIAIVEPVFTKLESEQFILDELFRMKRFKQAPYVAIRLAILIQKYRLNKVNL